MAAILKATLIIAITMALSIAITMKSTAPEDQAKPGFVDKDLSSSQDQQLVNEDDENRITLPSKRVSRFLAEKEKNPRAADHCKKDNEICYLTEGRNSTCCNNKCMDLAYDDKNCGACKNKCKFTQTCCRGQCVELAFDKRHCGACNHRCDPGEYCVYGMCNYA